MRTALGCPRRQCRRPAYRFAIRLYEHVFRVNAPGRNDAWLAYCIDRTQISVPRPACESPGTAYGRRRNPDIFITQVDRFRFDRNMLTVTADTLAVIDAFRNLDRASRVQIVPVCVPKIYPRSQMVIGYQEQSTGVFFIVSGSVRATVFTQRGREIAYADLTAGDMFGELSAIDGKPRTTHVVTLEESTLITIARAQFLALLETYPEIAQATLRKVAGMIRSLNDRVYEFSALDVSGRIRAELVRLAAGDTKNPRRATVPKMPTHQELANRVATHREAVSRELSRLEKEGVTRKEGQSLIINDLDRLTRMIGDTRPNE